VFDRHSAGTVILTGTIGLNLSLPTITATARATTSFICYVMRLEALIYENQK
jgi:hypothetical protein